MFWHWWLGRGRGVRSWRRIAVKAQQFEKIRIELVTQFHYILASQSRIALLS